MAELIITNLLGWANKTRLYLINDDYWIISTIEMVSGFDGVTEDISKTPDEDFKLTGHCEIYRANCKKIPILGPVQISGGPEEPGVEYEHDWISETICIVKKDGEEYARVEMSDVGEYRYEVEAIDSDNNPLNGLTPEYVLPYKTTFEEAISYIEENYNA